MVGYARHRSFDLSQEGRSVPVLGGRLALKRLGFLAGWLPVLWTLKGAWSRSEVAWSRCLGLQWGVGNWAVKRIESSHTAAVL